MEQNKPEIPDPAVVRLTKFRNFVAYFWAAMVGFALVGSCTGRREASVYVLVLIAVMWVTMRIIREAADAYLSKLDAQIVVLKAKIEKLKKDDEPPSDT